MQKHPLMLLQTKRFLPLFITQFLEAFNDNLFRNALLILITYTLASNTNKAEILVATIGGVFILPFFLFSATAGQIADKFEKTFLIKIIKFSEIFAMLIAAVGFYLHSILILMGTLFFLGVHSAFFGPIKFSILPDHLHENELISGNALISASTFLSILLGTIIGGVLIAIPLGTTLVPTLGLVCALVGLFSSFYIPRTVPDQKKLRISSNFIRETFKIIETARENKHVFLSILGLSWFWLVGAAFLTLFPSFTRYTLGANSYVATLFLTLFSVGIGLGSLLSDQLQKGRIDAKFVPFGILGMTVFMLDLFFAAKPALNEQLIGIGTFLLNSNHWRIMIDTLLFSICGGLYVVPLYAIIQHHSRRTHRSRIVAANNIINSVFMVAVAIFLGTATYIGISIPAIFLIFGIVNLGVAIYICKLLPDALVKSFISWLLRLIYRVKVEGLDNYLQANPRSIIIANHVSYLDGLLLSAFLPDRVIFAINTQIARSWWIKPVMRLVDAFELDPTNPIATKSLIRQIRRNRRCFIFPEGRITITGGLMKIHEGPGMIADKAEADIIPIRIDGAQYSHFSRLSNKVRIRWFPQITIRILPARQFKVDPSIKGRERRDVISNKLYDLMTDLMFESSAYQRTSFNALIDAKKIHGRKHIILEDIQRKPINYHQLLTRAYILGRNMTKHSSKQDVIGLLLPNMNATVICFFAAHAYGRIPALLNFSAGTDNILNACRLAKITIVYTAKKFIETTGLEALIKKLSENNITVIFLEDLKHKISIASKLTGLIHGLFAEYFYKKNNPNHSGKDTAVILFTSGSEGTPKGVALSHINLQANCFQMTARVAFNLQDRAFSALPMFHAFGLTVGTLLPVFSGIRTFLYPSPLHYRVVPELVYDTNATMLFGTDTFLSGYAKNAHPYDFYSIRYIFAGAEKLKSDTLKTWSEKFGIRIFEGYGCTEASPVISMNTPMHNKNNTVGRFLPKIEYKIAPVNGINEGGRLFISGPNVMQGYILANNPGVILPLENGWYDTGDIVSVDYEGYITIQGRVKRFAKLAGEMVSLTALENHIANLWPNNLHASVAIPDDKRGEIVVLVTDNPGANREDIIRYFRKNEIAELYLPKQILIVNEMFILGSGKVDFSQVQKYAEQKFMQVAPQCESELEEVGS